MGIASPSSALTFSSFSLPRAAVRHHRNHIFPHQTPHHRPFSLRVANESKGTELSTDTMVDISEADKIVDGMDFGELCNEFECISSPLVESTARLLLRDILELQKGTHFRGVYAAYIKYNKAPGSLRVRGCVTLIPSDAEPRIVMDPVRRFTGREKYNRPLWITGALDNASVSVQEMVMLSTSILNIKWTLRGTPKSIIAVIGGPLIIRVDSKFILNQISGQVIEHEEVWDLSASSIIAQLFFWTSRRIFATTEAGRDVADSVKNLNKRLSSKENPDVYPDPTGDPTKFFQKDDGFQRDAYQFALFLAILYFLVQFLRTTL